VTVREPAKTVEEAIVGRQSIRAFLPRPVPRDLVERVLRTAGRAPSGTNIQPWRVYVVSGQARERLSSAILARFEAGEAGRREYDYYPVKWREPYLGRRRACGFGLYATLGIGREDKAGMKAQRARNYLFFDAPVGLVFTLDRDLERGSWLDMGMFIQSVMVAARGLGLDTCPQAAFCDYHALIQEMLAIPSGETIVCGMALGFADTAAPVNTFRTEREPLESFVTWIGDGI
jgi:nitroreductase